MQKIEEAEIERTKRAQSCVVEAGKWGYPMHEVRGDHQFPWHGACPFCYDGDDRFMVTADQQRFWCRRCNKEGDIYDLVEHVGNMNFLEVHEYLRGHLTGDRTRGPKAIDFAVDLAKYQEEPPDPFGQIDQKQRRELIDEFRFDLFHGAGDTKKVFDSPPAAYGKYTATEYLNSRMIGVKQQNDFQLGFNSKPRMIAGKIMPPGIVIPLMGEHEITYETGYIVGFKVRTYEGQMKYWRIGKGPYCLNQDSLDIYRTALVAEGEFDCMVLATHFDDRYACVTMGGTTSGMTPGKLHRLFTESKEVFWCFDNDEAGYKALRSILRKNSGGRFKSIQLPHGVNDVTDFRQQERDLEEFEEYFFSRIEGRLVD